MADKTTIQITEDNIDELNIKVGTILKDNEGLYWKITDFNDFTAGMKVCDKNGNEIENFVGNAERAIFGGGLSDLLNDGVATYYIESEHPEVEKQEETDNIRVFTVCNSVFSAVDRADFLSGLENYVNGKKIGKDIYKIKETLNKENIKPIRFIYEGNGYFGPSIYESFVCKKNDNSGFRYLMVPHNAEYYKGYDKLVLSEVTYSNIDECQKALIDTLVNLKENHNFKIENESFHFYNIPQKFKQPLLSYIADNEKEICQKAEEWLMSHSDFKRYENIKDNIALYLIQEDDAVNFNSPEWIKKFEMIELSMSNPLLANGILKEEKKENRTMAKEQKCIAKWIDKDGNTVDFERFSTNNIKKISNDCIELNADTLIASKDTLSNFDFFKVFETEPDGTNEKLMLTMPAQLYLESVANFYKKKHEHFPYEDEFDAARWKEITDKRAERMGITELTPEKYMELYNNSINKKERVCMDLDSAKAVIDSCAEDFGLKLKKDKIISVNGKYPSLQEIVPTEILRASIIGRQQKASINLEARVSVIWDSLGITGNGKEYIFNKYLDKLNELYRTDNKLEKFGFNTVDSADKIKQVKDLTTWALEKHPEVFMTRGKEGADKYNASYPDTLIDIFTIGDYLEDKESELSLNKKDVKYSYFVKDTAEFEQFADFEPITNLTAEEAVSKFAELRKQGFSAGIGINIPNDIVFDDPDGNGITILIEDENKLANFAIFGDNFIKDLNNETHGEVLKVRIAAYEDLYEELVKQSIPNEYPQFVFDKKFSLELNNNKKEENVNKIEVTQSEIEEEKRNIQKRIISLKNELENPDINNPDDEQYISDTLENIKHLENMTDEDIKDLVIWKKENQKKNEKSRINYYMERKEAIEKDKNLPEEGNLFSISEIEPTYEITNKITKAKCWIKPSGNPEKNIMSFGNLNSIQEAKDVITKIKNSGFDILSSPSNIVIYDDEKFYEFKSNTRVKTDLQDDDFIKYISNDFKITRRMKAFEKLEIDNDKISLLYDYSDSEIKQICKGLWEAEDKILLDEYRKQFPSKKDMPPVYMGSTWVQHVIQAHRDEYKDVDFSVLLDEPNSTKKLTGENIMDTENNKIIISENLKLNNITKDENRFYTGDLFVPDADYIKESSINSERFAMPVATWKDNEPNINIHIVKRLISEPHNKEKEFLDFGNNNTPSIFSEEKWNLIREQKTFDTISKQIEQYNLSKNKKEQSIQINPVPLESILSVMEMKPEVTPEGRIQIYDQQRGEYIPTWVGQGDGDLGFEDAAEIFERLDIYINDYFIHDMEEQLEAGGVTLTGNETLKELCDYTKAQLEAGITTVSQGELNLAMGIVHPDTVIMPEGFIKQDDIKIENTQSVETQLVNNIDWSGYMKDFFQKELNMKLEKTYEQKYPSYIKDRFVLEQNHPDGWAVGKNMWVIWDNLLNQRGRSGGFFDTEKGIEAGNKELNEIIDSVNKSETEALEKTYEGNGVYTCQLFSDYSGYGSTTTRHDILFVSAKNNRSGTGIDVAGVRDSDCGIIRSYVKDYAKRNNLESEGLIVSFNPVYKRKEANKLWTDFSMLAKEKNISFVYQDGDKESRYAFAIDYAQKHNLPCFLIDNEISRKVANDVDFVVFCKDYEDIITKVKSLSEEKSFSINTQENQNDILKQCNAIFEKYTNTHFTSLEEKYINECENEETNRQQALMSLCNMKYIHCTTKDKDGYWEINKGKEITANEARKLMSYDDFASGVDRASFHITAGRTANDGSFIYFNDGDRKRDIQPYVLTKKDVELLSHYEEAGGSKENIPEAILQELSKTSINNHNLYNLTEFKWNLSEKDSETLKSMKDWAEFYEKSFSDIELSVTDKNNEKHSYVIQIGSGTSSSKLEFVIWDKETKLKRDDKELGMKQRMQLYPLGYSYIKTSEIPDDSIESFEKFCKEHINSLLDETGVFIDASLENSKLVEFNGKPKVLEGITASELLNDITIKTEEHAESHSDEKQTSSLELTDNDLKNARALLPREQYQLVLSYTQGEEGEHFKGIIKEISSKAEAIKGKSEILTEDEKHPLAFKYTVGNSRFYFSEWDGGDELFGYVVLNGNTQDSEWGYTSLEELKNSGSKDRNGFPIIPEMTFYSLEDTIEKQISVDYPELSERMGFTHKKNHNEELISEFGKEISEALESRKLEPNAYNICCAARFVLRSMDCFERKEVISIMEKCGCQGKYVKENTEDFLTEVLNSESKTASAVYSRNRLYERINKACSSKKPGINKDIHSPDSDFDDIEI